MSKYDTIIIGAGMSGLAAGIRLAHYGRRVCILERHFRAGGLNSWYRRGGRDYDVGLHAMTNFVAPDVRSAPLNRLLRQLRLDYRALDLVPQGHSEIRFPGVALRFTNDFRDFEAAVVAAFPDQAAGFARLVETVRAIDAYALDKPYASARDQVRQWLSDPLLTEMLFCPLLFYGSAVAGDMDFTQFCIMFRSLFLEGFCRPRRGVRQVIELLEARFAECGGELRLSCGVRELALADGRVARVVTDDGAALEADTILSSAGYVETLSLCSAGLPPGTDPGTPGEVAFTETILALDTPPATLGFTPAVMFYSAQPRFHYGRPAAVVDEASAVVCAPGNFGPAADLAGAELLRVTHLADYAPWMQMSTDAYRENKGRLLERQLQFLEHLAPGVRGHVVATDAFTPRTVWRFTGHLHGAVYGAPAKVKDGRTPINNLYICGTDQGFLGIVGALMSGVSMANYHFLRG